MRADEGLSSGEKYTEYEFLKRAERRKQKI
jgi:hypothetical protein